MYINSISNNEGSDGDGSNSEDSDGEGSGNKVLRTKSGKAFGI
jgi:hypothetical protein